MSKSLEERFWAKVVKADGCWGWLGSKSQGYGTITKGKRGDGMLRAPRVSYEIHFGPIPEGLVVRHKCDNPECTNPDHLEVGTRAENSADMVARRRHFRHNQTHCKNGHEFTPENTKISKSGGRECRTCRNAAERLKRREKRGDMFGVATYKVRTHCKNGHEFTESNTYIRPDGYKECIICRNVRMAKFQMKRKVV